MQYISPFEFLEISPEANLTPADLKRAKSKILTQFDLEETQFIPYKGGEVDKQTALSLIEEMGNLEIAGYHRKVALNPNLLGFLEKGSIDSLSSLESASFKVHTSFHTWLSPIFAHQFAQLLSKSLRNGRYMDAYIILSYGDYLAANDYKKAYSSIEQMLRDLKDRADSQEFTRRDHYAMESSDLAMGVGQLPEIYGDLYDAFALSLLEYAEQLQSQGKSNKAETVLMHADNLKLRPNTQKRLEQFLSQLRAQNRGSRQSTTSDAYQAYAQAKKKPKIPIWGTLVLLVGIILAGYLFTSKSNQLKNPTSVRELTWQDKLSIRMDNNLFFNHLGMSGIGDVDFLDAPADTTHPETGFVPYKVLYPNIDCSGSSCTPIVIKNTQGRDIVAFFQSKSELEPIVHHAYIRNGESYRIPGIAPDDYEFIWYGGNAWKPNSLTEKGRSIGTFRKHVTEPYNSENYEGKRWVNIGISSISEPIEVNVEPDSIRVTR